MRVIVPSLILAVLAAFATPAAAQSYLAKPLVVGGNPGPAHNYVCPNVDGGGALDCYLDALRHLYTMCKHVKSIEILEHGYERAEEGTNTAKSASCIDKQKGNIARPYQAALRELASVKPAAQTLRALHEFWLGALASLKWRAGESDEDYKVRTGFVYVDIDERADEVRVAIDAIREGAQVRQAAARSKAPR
jgi:hypothetical protein